MEYHNTEHEYKVLKTKNRIQEENKMLQNEMTRIRQMRRNHRLTNYGANVENIRKRIEECEDGLDKMNKVISKN